MATEVQEIPQEFIERANAVHRSVCVTAPYFEYYGYDSLFADRGASQCDLEKIDAANIGVLGVAVANGSAGYFEIGPSTVTPAGSVEWAHQRLLRLYSVAMETIKKCPRVRIVSSKRDIPQPGSPRDAAGSIAVLPLVTGHAYMHKLEIVEEMFKLGLRITHPANLTCNLWCRAMPPLKVDGQLQPIFNDYGKQMVARLNELGIIIDLAHMCDESSKEVLKVSTKPVIDGHTSSRTNNPFGRGHDDETLKLIANGGGVVGIHFADHLWTKKVWGNKYKLGGYDEPTPIWDYNKDLLATLSDPDLRMQYRKDSKKRKAFFDRQGYVPPVEDTTQIGTVADMADHVIHMVNVMGIDHVGLGGDVNGITLHSWPIGMAHVGELPMLSAELLRRGWTDAQLRKFLSDNWLRVFRECLPE